MFQFKSKKEIKPLESIPEGKKHLLYIVSACAFLTLLFLLHIIITNLLGFSHLLSVAFILLACAAIFYFTTSKLYRSYTNNYNLLKKKLFNVNGELLTALRQKSENDAVLASMVEGVIAVDSDEKILSLNSAARNLLGLTELPTERSSLQETIRNSEFQRLMKMAISSHHPIEGEVSLLDENNTILLVHASPLQDSDGNSIGAVLVFHDITKLRKLESIRRDFVANVSHELKTPITSIKGFVETLIDGAINNPSDSSRFLDIILKQSDRLSAIIEDLLALSRLEQDESEDEIRKELASATDIMDRSAQSCQIKAGEKEIKIVCNGGEKVYFNVNPHLLEQALVNLINNAIQYSQPQSQVIVTCSTEGQDVTFTVQDFGIGISKEHLPRLFERFYRVDRARSRKLGGTGLGLAIVKHIAQAHGGYIRVESIVGKGSIFTLNLPGARTAAPLFSSSSL
jgi:two-component system phosphate regulon sensor histidine kinase PhoR